MRVVNAVKTYASSLLDMIYPRRCVGCNGVVDSGANLICWNCTTRIPFITLPFCFQCGDPVAGQVDSSYVCRHCSENIPSFDKARSVARYRGLLKDMLCEFKYAGALWMRRDLAAWLLTCLQSQFDTRSIDVVTCVPLHPVKQRDRGYNQAALLAKDVSSLIGKSFSSKMIRRIRHTPSQTNLTARQRRDNVLGAFACRVPDNLRLSRALLIDDVMTTGATVNECARVLKEAGVSRVEVVTVARG